MAIREFLTQDGKRIHLEKFEPSIFGLTDDVMLVGYRLRLFGPPRIVHMSKGYRSDNLRWVFGDLALDLGGLYSLLWRHGCTDTAWRNLDWKNIDGSPLLPLKIAGVRYNLFVRRNGTAK